MNKSIYIILALVGILVMNSCSDDEFLSGNPDMELGTGKVSALYGDSLPFTIKASDVDVPLSTLKAKLFYGEELVSETVIRTKTSGSDYTGKVFVPYYPNVIDGRATLKFVLRISISLLRKWSGRLFCPDRTSLMSLWLTKWVKNI